MFYEKLQILRIQFEIVWNDREFYKILLIEFLEQDTFFAFKRAMVTPRQVLWMFLNLKKSKELFAWNKVKIRHVLLYIVDYTINAHGKTFHRLKHDIISFQEKSNDFFSINLKTNALKMKLSLWLW